MFAQLVPTQLKAHTPCSETCVESRCKARGILRLNHVFMARAASLASLLSAEGATALRSSGQPDTHLMVHKPAVLHTRRIEKCTNL